MKSTEGSRWPAPVLLRPFQEFFAQAAAGAILLMICTTVALAWANSPWSDSYVQLWETKLSLTLGGAAISKSLHHWINDGLMAVFFFVVGLEIKREFLVGELASPRQAAGAYRWRRTSRSRSACCPCSGRASPSRSRSSSPPSPSWMTSAR